MGREERWGEPAMSRTTKTDRDIAMKGGGYYSLATTGAKDVIDGGTPLVLDAIAAMDIPDDGRPFTMADMGCADGGTSIGLIGSALKEIRKRAPSRPIRMVYTDLPRNDFGQLFRVVHGQTDIRGYVDEIKDLYIYASATSFHEAIFPPETLHFGFSATASHYISERPCRIPNHVHMVGARGAERAAYEEQGRKDWEIMLQNRAAELATGGRLALFNFGIDEDGRYLGNTGGVNMFDTFNELWRELADNGVITHDEYTNTNFPQCYRTVEQFAAPLKDPENQVHKAGLRLEHLETRVVPCPYATAFAAHGDPEKFAREYIPTLRSWSESIFVSGLSPNRPLAERQDIVERFYKAYEERVRRAPEGHGMDYVHIYMICSKV
jgi:hypothetical protein